MRILDYYIVDVFAEAKYRGNQLAVFMDTKGLSTEEMQSIALETNFAETTFIESGERSNGGFNVKIFTPDTEVPFAGHPTLGTAYILSKYIDPEASTIVMNYPVGQVPVDVNRESGEIDLLWMKQINPTFLGELDQHLTADILGVPVDAIRNDFPVEQVSTGLPFYIVPFKDLESLKSIKINLDPYEQLMNRQDDQIITPAFLSFCPETTEAGHDLSSRMHYMENGQIVEDAATGSANGCLLSYLLKHEYLGTESVDIKVEQGYEIRRPSVIYHRGKKVDENTYEINIGGRVVEVSKGKWRH